MGIIQTERIDIAYETSGSGEAGAVILIRGQGSQLIHWPESLIVLAHIRSVTKHVSPETEARD